ncbi:MAG: lamin tail domain-containing protein [Rhodothermales bacterium]
MKLLARSLFALAVLVSSRPDVASGQVNDDFADGDFTQNPAWSGDSDLWSVVPFGADFAVNLNGTATSDTVYLATPSTVAYGTWKIAVRYEGGRLSNFNQIRVFLSSSSPDLTGAVAGYHVQLGTNDRNVRLYRSDPSTSDGRVLLAESNPDLLGLDDATVLLDVSRSATNDWTVKVDGSTVFSFTETADALPTSSWFGVWVKHSASRNQHYWFDDVDVTDTLPPDETPPSVLSAVYVAAANTVQVQFSEPLDETSVVPASFDISDGIGQPFSAELLDPTSGPASSLVRLSFTSTLPTGDYTVAVDGVKDLAGNTLVAGNAAFSVVSDTDPPTLVSATAVDNSNIEVVFSETLDPTSACSASNYVVTPSIGSPNRVICPGGAFASVTLQYDSPITGGSYQLAVSGVSDLAGNTLASATTNLLIAVTGDVPGVGDIVVNEIAYDPDETDGEYIELLNLSSKTFLLTEFEFSDNRLVRSPLVTESVLMEPGQYVVVVRNAALFTSQFPNVAFYEAPAWPALNNSGDAVVLFRGNVTIDSVSFVPSWGGSGPSLERRDPAGPSNSATNWGTSTATAGGTPNARNSIYEPDLSPPELTFAEQVSGTIVRTYFSEPLDAATVTPPAFKLNGVSPQSVTLVMANNVVDLSFDSPLSGGTVEASGISDITGNVLDAASVVVARRAEPGDIVINEILFDPRDDDGDGLQNQTEFIELYNVSADLLSLAGIYWTDIADERNEADTMRIASTAVGIQPGGYAVVFAQSESINLEDVYSASDLVLAFPNDYAADQTALLPFFASSLGLLNSGDLVRLHRSDDAVLDEVQYDPDWHHPNLRETKGTSIERIDPIARSNTSDNWTSSVAVAGATPGLRNSVFLESESSVDEDESVVIEPSTFSPDADGVDDFAAIRYRLASEEALVRVRIFDSRGRKVRELERGLLSTRNGTVIWDGRDDEGLELPVGIYVILLQAIDSDRGTSEAYKAAVVLARQL